MRLPSALVLALVANPAPAAEPPGILNAGAVETRSAASGLEGLFRGLLPQPSGKAWIGYTVPARLRPRSWGCGDGGWDGDGGWCSDNASKEGLAASAEGPARLRVLFGIEGGRVRRIRTFNDDCKTDLCGLPLTWLTDVAPRQSVALLGSLVGSEAQSLAPQIMAALALHAEPQAIDVLLDLARGNPSAHVRGQALFWLAQRAGERATAGIRQALAEDPETEVKKRAVFALSQLPRDRGIPLLIEAARSNPNPAVRRQAMFWLGQSGDPRALAYFEDVLKR
jgi:hypothetical protein